jgi:hypothetical protein
VIFSDSFKVYRFLPLRILWLSCCFVHLGKKDFRNKNLDLLQSTHHLLNLGLDSSLVEEKVPRSGFFFFKKKNIRSGGAARLGWAPPRRRWWVGRRRWRLFFILFFEIVERGERDRFRERIKGKKWKFKPEYSFYTHSWSHARASTTISCSLIFLTIRF